MHLIVDGYNVMSQSPRLQFLDVMDLQAGREALLELLALYRSRSHHQGHFMPLYQSSLSDCESTAIFRDLSEI